MEKKMMEHVNEFKIIGIAVTTSNKDGRASQDLGQLWQRFFVQAVADQIPGKVTDEIYAIYTDYESDFMGNYTAIIGMKVSSLDAIPEGMVGRQFDGGVFEKYIAKGEMPNAVVQTWMDIWNRNDELNRAYTYDFEVYGEKSQQGINSEVEIFIAK